MIDIDRIEDNHISGPIKANLDEIKELQQNKGPVLTGLPTGFTHLDRITSGLNNSDLIVLASHPHWGKTPFALNIARNVAVDSNVPVLIFSLEATKEQVSTRMLSAESKVSLVCMKRGRLGEGNWDRIKKASDILSNAPIYIDSSPGISMVEIEMEASAIKEKKGTSLIMIDYFQLIKGEPGAPNRLIERVEMAGDLKRLAEKLDVPMMLIFQLDEVDLEERNYRKPTLIDLADAGSLDQDADLVLLISRDEIIHPFERHCNRGRAEIVIAKNRRGSKGMAALNFSYHYSLFENI
jgi:replicative DNA helicase